MELPDEQEEEARDRGLMEPFSMLTEASEGKVAPRWAGKAVVSTGEVHEHYTTSAGLKRISRNLRRDMTRIKEQKWNCEDP